MRHRMSHRGFSRRSAHRKAMFENLAERSQYHASRLTTEEGNTHYLFEPLDGPGQGGLGDIEGLRRASDTTVLDHTEKGRQLAGVQSHNLFLCLELIRHWTGASAYTIFAW